MSLTPTDKIQAARALIEPLTGVISPAPWRAKEESLSIADTGDYEYPWVVRSSDQRIVAEFYGERLVDELNARLIAAAPALRDTVADLADLADAQAQENARLKATIRALDPVLERSGYAPSSLAREAIRAALGDAQ